MKTTLLLAATLGLLFALFSGCYTQLGTTRDDNQRDESYTSSQNYGDSTYSDSGEYNQEQSGYYDDDNWHSHARLGFSYYYPSYYWPSYAFANAYADPWAYNYYNAYDPWWCGTPMIGYSYYPGYAYYPGNYYYYPPAYAYRYPYTNTSVKHGTRDFGSTRGGGDSRGSGETQFNAPATDRGGYNLPTGARYDAGRSAGGTQVVTPSKDNSRQVGNQRNTGARSATSRGSSQPVGTNRGVRGWGSRANVRGEGSRGKQTETTQGTGSTQSATPSSGTSTRTRETNSGTQPRNTNSGTRQPGSSRGNAPSSPPPAPRMQSQPSTPPPSGGGGRSGGGSRRP